MTVLAVDPDPGTTSRLARPLRALGYRLETCARADRALEMIRERRFHVILTAARLPDMDGVSFCKELRGRGVQAGLIVLGFDGRAEQRLEAFRARVDDVHPRPINAAELCARVDVLARWVVDGDARLSSAGSISIDENTGTAYLGSEALVLTRHEFLLLRELVRAPDTVVSHQQLLQRVWGLHHDPGSNLLQVHCHNLRTKLGSARVRLLTVRGRGYRLVPDALGDHGAGLMKDN